MRFNNRIACLVSSLHRFSEEEAASSVEWGVLASLIAAAVVFVILQLGVEVQSMYALVHACIVSPSSCS